MSKCPYCANPITAEQDFVVCPRCMTPHHPECWEENGQHCSTLGCSGSGQLPALHLAGGKFVGEASPGALPKWKSVGNLVPRWIFATMIGWIMGTVLGISWIALQAMSMSGIRVNDKPIGEALIGINLAVALALLGGGIAIGIAQWLVLRPYMTRAISWVLVTSLGWILGSVVLVFISFLMPLVFFVPGLIPGTVVGIVQWLFLTQRVRHASQWILYGIFGWTVGSATFVLTLLSAMMGIRTPFAIAPWGMMLNIQWDNPEALGTTQTWMVLLIAIWILCGTLMAWITGTGMARLLRSSIEAYNRSQKQALIPLKVPMLIVLGTVSLIFIVTTGAMEPCGWLDAILKSSGCLRAFARTGEMNWGRSVVFSPDGTMIASSAYGKAVGLWRVTDGSFVRSLAGVRDTVWSVAFSSNGTIIAGGLGDATIQLWRTSDGTLLRTITGHVGAIAQVAFSPDGSTLASASLDGTVRLWRVSDGVLVRILTGHTDSVNGVSFSSDGSMLATAWRDKTIRLWRVIDGSVVRVLTGHTEEINSLAFSSDGTALVSGAEDETIRVWQLSNGQILRTLKGDLVTGVSKVAFSPDGTVVASASGDGKIRLWRMWDGALIRTLTVKPGFALTLDFSPNNMTVVSGCGDGTIKLWDAN